MLIESVMTTSREKILKKNTASCSHYGKSHFMEEYQVIEFIHCVIFCHCALGTLYTPPPTPLHIEKIESVVCYPSPHKLHLLSILLQAADWDLARLSVISVFNIKLNSISCIIACAEISFFTVRDTASLYPHLSTVLLNPNPCLCYSQIRLFHCSPAGPPTLFLIFSYSDSAVFTVFPTRLQISLCVHKTVMASSSQMSWIKHFHSSVLHELMNLNRYILVNSSLKVSIALTLAFCVASPSDPHL